MFLFLSRILPILLFAVVILGYVRLIVANRRMWPAAAFVIALSAHWIVYYLAVLLTGSPPSYYTNVWLNGLALHTAGTLVYAAWVMYHAFKEPRR